ncbi:muscle M-line assembly protein unc-89-like isoform X2 [Penaeus monodon]|nr:muscle M-line assembly protein unc-89-like isoform X2 [Penaeus monodon]
MPDRRRQRHQRTRQDAGVRDDPVGASNRDEVRPKAPPPEMTRPERQGGSGVSYAEPKEYEAVTIMPDKEAPSEPQKYRRREVISNWSRYEELPPDDEPEDGEDYMIGEDFSKILEQQANSADGGFFKMKGEKMWDDTEISILTSHGLGALNVADLVAAFNTIPLHVQLNIPEEALPKRVVKHYVNLAEDHLKLYKPSSGYADCMDINEKILQSLKISEDEPLTLVNDEAADDRQGCKNAVDVALTLSSEFAPEPDDVDLDTLIREPSPEKRPSPVKEMKRRVKETTPVKEFSPAKEYSPMRDFKPVKDVSPIKDFSPVKEFSPIRDISPVKEVSPFREISPLKEPSPFKETSPFKEISPLKDINPIQDASFMKEVSPLKEISPMREIPQVSNETNPVTEEPKVEDMPKVETEVTHAPKERRRGRREANTSAQNKKSENEKPKEFVRDKSPKEKVKEKSPREKRKEKGPKEQVKEKSPREQVKEKSPREQVKEKSPREQVKEKSPWEQVKEKSPKETNLIIPDFSVPKKMENNDSPMEFNFGLLRASASALSESKKTAKDEKKEFELPPLKLEVKEESVPEGPVIDLDAPVKAEKPVLLLSKTEADDLEDWLDSVLDD